jgi:hypothetical protein
MLIRTIVKGLVGGAVGTAVMTLGENLEQSVTGRPDSYVPARTAGRLFQLRRPDARALGRNWAMHWGTGAVGGVARALMAQWGFRGLPASITHFVMRFSTDQTLENVTGVSAPPWTWPRDEAATDLFHKGVYAYVTGVVIDVLVRPTDQSMMTEETSSV